MKTKVCILATAAILGSFLILLPARVAAQSAGRIEFVASVAPTGGQPEPVRQMTFYLLRKSLDEIRVEAGQFAPGMDLDHFIDGLSASPELKAWMHRHQSVRLTGDDFLKSLTPEGIVGTPEFFTAYMAHNAAYRGEGFPKPQFKEKDKKADPEKYKAQQEQYYAAIRKFIAGAPDTVQGMDLELVNLNPSAKWEMVDRKHRQAIDVRARQLAEQRYLVARATTDLDGRGWFSSVPAGNYWIDTLGTEAFSGDVRLGWDYPISVRSGETASVELSNLNAAPSSASAQNSNP
jgi:hypothetical protein